MAALLDDAMADNEVARALVAKGNPVIKALWRGEDILKILELRCVPVSEAQRQEILGCRDLERLDRWFDRALLAASAEEVTSEP